MRESYKTEDGIKVYIDDREYIDGVPIVNNMEYLLKMRLFLRELKYKVKKVEKKYQKRKIKKCK